MWKNAKFCSECHNELTTKQVYYNEGRCPHCGYKGPNTLTTVCHYDKGYRLERVAPWWKFWIPKKRVY